MISKTEQEIMSEWNLKGSLSVSICCITYNHEKFISETIDGFLMQKTTFPFGIIIGEDCSTDDTLEIINEYKSKYPNLIQVLTNDINVGMQKNFERTFNACTGTYIALCEGDDFWTDAHKLQKQISFLEANSQFAMCCHKSENYNEEEKGITSHYPTINNEEEFVLYDLFHTNIANTCTFVYRNYHIQLPVFFENLYVGDWPLHMIQAQHGKIKYFPESMSRYRIHSQGVWSGEDFPKKLEHINDMLKHMDNYFQLKYHKQIYQTIGRNLFDQSLYFIDINDRDEFCKKLFHVINPSILSLIKTICKDKIRRYLPLLFNTIKNIVNIYQKSPRMENKSI